MRFVRATPAAALTTFLLACGGESEGGSATPSTLDTGLDDSLLLNEVTPQQAAAACDRTEAVVTARFGPEVLQRVSCDAQSAAATSDPEECRTASAECLENGESLLDGSEAPEFDCEGDAAIPEGCTATVGQYEGCVNDLLDAVDAAAASLGCDNAANVSLATLLGNDLTNLELPASCSAIPDRCTGELTGGLGQ